ncbi:MAG: Na+/H+ antiporter NhaA [Verrucomicrobia bacterium]|nr:Na+/H+ antiporter NhaA [Prolixibacteraceae bacterium]
MKLTHLFKDFFNSEKAGGLILIIATILSLILANTAFQTTYTDFWTTDLGGHTVTQYINDGLMAIFFLMIGLELEREIYTGELADLKSASLPIMGAVGGMLVPAALYMVFNFGTTTQDGAGIPMATDIAFAVGVMSLLGNRVPSSLKVFLIALAVIDDLGAILVIALFYTQTIFFNNLLIALVIFGVLLILNRLRVHNLIPYLIGGALMWYFMLNSGIHATIAGVLLAFAVPFGNGDERSPSYVLQHFIHKPVAFIILPLFALANTAIVIQPGWYNGLSTNISLGIFTGLLIGKPLGIVLSSLLAVKVGFSSLPEGLQWKHIFGAGIIAGIGFTMSIFITLLAFDDIQMINQAKIAVMIASVIAGSIGFMWLKGTLKTIFIEEE